MDFFKMDGAKMLVDTFALEVYLPYEYLDSAYRGSSFYSVLGTKVRFLGVGNMRAYKTEKEMDNPEDIKCYPLGIPMLILSEPAEIDVREVRFSKGGRLRKCIVLVYYKGDSFLVNTETIKNVDAMMMLLSRLEQGKLDHIPPEVAVSIIRDCETMNGISLRIPSEEMEVFVAERYRDPNQPGRQYRYHTGAVDPDSMVSFNMRTDAIKSSTFQGVFHEDISTALVAASNRKKDGIVEEPGTFERVIRGLSLEDMKKEDYPNEESLT